MFIFVPLQYTFTFARMCCPDMFGGRSSRAPLFEFTSRVSSASQREGNDIVSLSGPVSQPPGSDRISCPEYMYIVLCLRGANGVRVASKVRQFMSTSLYTTSMASRTGSITISGDTGMLAYGLTRYL
jgi:hypothetical protein